MKLQAVHIQSFQYWLSVIHATVFLIALQYQQNIHNHRFTRACIAHLIYIVNEHCEGGSFDFQMFYAKISLICTLSTKLAKCIISQQHLLYVIPFIQM